MKDNILFENFILFDINESTNSDFSSLDDLLKKNKNYDSDYYDIFKRFYYHILKDKELNSFIDKMCLAVIEKADKKIFNNEIMEHKIMDCPSVIYLSNFVIITTMLNDDYFYSNKDYENLEDYVLNYNLISNLISWYEKFSIFFEIKNSAKKKELEIFFSKYMMMMNSINYIEKITLWVKTHKSVYYRLKHFEKIESIDSTPYVSINVEPYVLRNNFLVGKHFSTVTNMFIKNKKTLKTLKFLNYKYPIMSNSIGYKIDVEHYDLSLNFISNKIEYNKKLPSIDIKINDLFYFRDKVLVNTDTIYFAQCFDTRGRKYCISKYSYTNLKTMRFVGVKDTRIKYDVTKSIFFNKFIKYKNILGKYESIFDEVNIVLMQLFVTLGKHNKKTKHFRISIIEIITWGKELYESEIEIDDIYDSLEIFITKKIIDKLLIHQLNTPNYIINKDATASGFQHLAITLGVNKDMKWVFNLSDEPINDENDCLYWTDTYSYIINNFINDIRMPEEYKIYFTRKNLKPVIMTVNYGCTYYKCSNEFKQMIKTDDEKIDLYFKAFFLYITKLPFFTEKISKLQEDIIDKKKIVFNDVEVDFYLYKLKKYRTEYKTNNTRDSIQFYEISDEIDFKKTKTACIANFIHASDSELLRRCHSSTHTIHDCILGGIWDWCRIHDEYQTNLNLLSTKKIYNKNDVYTSSFLLI